MHASMCARRCSNVSVGANLREQLGHDAADPAEHVGDGVGVVDKSVGDSPPMDEEGAGAVDDDDDDGAVTGLGGGGAACRERSWSNLEMCLHSLTIASHFFTASFVSTSGSATARQCVMCSGTSTDELARLAPHSGHIGVGDIMQAMYAVEDVIEDVEVRLDDDAVELADVDRIEQLLVGLGTATTSMWPSSSSPRRMDSSSASSGLLNILLLLLLF
eukprot:PhM_4_TR11294/c1_g1_i1/m.93339